MHRIMTRRGSGPSGRLRQGWGYAWRICALIAGFMWSSPSLAACKENPGGTAPSGQPYDRYNSTLFQVAVRPQQTTIALPPSVTAGELLFSTQETPLPSLSGSSQGQAVPVYDCPAGTIERFEGNHALIGTSLYATGVPGIGYRVYYYISDTESRPAPVEYANPYRAGAMVFPFNGAHQLGTNLRTRIDFIATGDPIVPGIISAGFISGRASLAGGGAISTPPLYRVFLAESIRITPPTCSVSNTAALTVQLPGLPVHMLQRGEGAGITTANLELACSSPSDVSPSIKITPTNPVAGYPATLGNQETGSEGARGVGIQVWLADPVTSQYRHARFGEVENGMGASLEGLPSSRWLFRVGASYLQVEPTVTAGKVRAGAVLTFTYN
ncbi:fimbrial protein [Bordetella petrii]|uniref:Fimbrial protein n=1 Tax=Bordetella petrii TaxID=94624 RepID=A0ABT7W513_9BORD|nr:fimbrial protein [Bordetella petrii]MDM9560289.1 fimbrial protein [Bordetella petrii]